MNKGTNPVELEMEFQEAWKDVCDIRDECLNKTMESIVDRDIPSTDELHKIFESHLFYSDMGNVLKSLSSIVVSFPKKQQPKLIARIQNRGEEWKKELERLREEEINRRKS